MPVLNLTDDQASLIAVALQRLGDTDGEYTKMTNELTAYIHQQRAEEDSNAEVLLWNEIFNPEILATLTPEQLKIRFDEATRYLKEQGWTNVHSIT